MEPSQDLASAGEFNGTESGWTTYIGSPIHSEIYNDDEQSADMDEYGNNFKNSGEKIDDDDEVEKNDENKRNTNDEESDDDSMASDASSGPSHLQHVCIKGSHGLNEHEKILTAKRATKQVRKTKYEGLVAKEEESLLVADSASSHT